MGEKRFWVGFDLGGTKMLAKVYDAAFVECGKKRKKTKAYEGADVGLERIQAVIDKALAEAEVAPAQLAGIGVGSPGPLDLANGVILDTPNLGWRQVPLRRFLEDTYGCPVALANDVDAGVFGEYRFGAGQGGYCVLGVFPGTGIGGGCVYNGQLLRGKTLSAMEIGHMQVVPDGALCGCGRRGCLETVASRLSISAAVAAAAYRGEAPTILDSCGMDLREIRSGALAAAIAAGDASVEAIVRHAAHWLGIAVANVVNLLGADKVVLGGGLVEALPQLICAEVEEAARARVMPAFTDQFTVAPAQLGDDATVKGAAAWAQASLA